MGWIELARARGVWVQMRAIDANELPVILNAHVAIETGVA